MTVIKILLADDGSSHAGAAATLLGNLPLQADQMVTVLRVFPSTKATEMAELEQALQATCTLLKEKGTQVRSDLALGSPAEQITEYAEKNDTDLIVMGAKGLRSTLGILLGGVAQQVVEYSHCPVLVVRASQNRLQNVLLATDGSENSEQAVLFMGQFPFPAGARIRVMHVLPPPPFPILTPEMPYQGAVPIAPQPITEVMARQRVQEEKDGEALLARTVKTLQGFGLEAESVLKRGDAATEMIEFIKNHAIDLVVVGSRGLSQVRSWLMGSVSRKLVHYSDASVLVVRGAMAD